MPRSAPDARCARALLLGLILACAASAQDAPKLREWVGELASKDEAVRSRAEALLVDAGEAALPALDAALKKEPPGSELHRRLQEVRGKAETGRWAKLLARGKHLVPIQPVTPVVVSPDGKALLTVQRVERGDEGSAYEFVVLALEGGGPTSKVVVPTTVTKDDFLVNQVRACSWSRDSKRFAVVQAGPERKLLRAGHAGLDGAVTLLEPKTHTATHDLSFDPNGDRAWYLETTGYELEAGKWKLLELDLAAGATKTLKEGEGPAIGLTASPDGKRLAWIGVAGGTREMAVSVLDLAKGEVKVGPPYRGDDYFWDGPPMYLWGADSARVLYQGRPPAGGKRPSIVTALDAGTGEARTIDPQAAYDLLAPIDGRYVSVHERRLGGGVLDLESGAVTWIQDGGLLIERRGDRRVVVVGREITVE